MKTLYIDGQPIVYDPNPIYSGEEATIHRYEKEKLIKIWKEQRRKNLPQVQPDIYLLLSKYSMQYFYFPLECAYDQNGNFKAHTMLEFKNLELATHAQRGNIEKIISSLEGIEAETKILSSDGIQIRDMKLPHILYNDEQELLGIIDCGGLYQKVSNKDVWIENLKEMNYYLRQALLWANYEGTKHEMLGFDFPEIYDELDEGTMTLSEVLKEEVSHYKVNTLEELKQQYQKQKFYEIG